MYNDSQQADNSYIKQGLNLPISGKRFSAALFVYGQATLRNKACWVQARLEQIKFIITWYRPPPIFSRSKGVRVETIPVSCSIMKGPLDAFTILYQILPLDLVSKS